MTTSDDHFLSMYKSSNLPLTKYSEAVKKMEMEMLRTGKIRIRFEKVLEDAMALKIMGPNHYRKEKNKLL